MALKRLGLTLLGVLLVTLKSSGLESERKTKSTNSDEYVKIILEGMRDALDYTLPTDAQQYRVCAKSKHSQCPRKTGNYGVFDFIVIGSGASGSAIASRLSEEKQFNVLLLEAGHFGNDFIDIPAMAFYAQGSEYNWAYQSVPQTNCCLGMVDQKCQFQRGRGIGGTTLINGLVYSRGSAADYNRWGSQGNEDWSWEKVLPFFKKAEHNTIPDLDDNYHGTAGPINVEHSMYTTPHIEAFLAAHQEINYPILDYNGPEHLGASRAQFNTRNGRRDSAGNAYIRPNLKRRNLHVSTGSYVIKILINSNTQRAYGVTFTKNNRLYRAKAKVEVILAAGAIASPLILMLSGVGPKSHLKDLGIPILSDLGVGDNLQDHICVFGTTIETNTSIEINSVGEYVDEFLDGKGPYTLPGNNAAVAFHKTNFSKYDSADYELLMVAPNRTDDYFRKGFAFTQDTSDAITEHLNNPSSFSILIYTMHPDSVGTIRLQSKDPFDYPRINPKFLDNDYDLETLYYGILLVEKLLATAPYRKLDAKLKPINLPNCSKYDMFSRNYWYCFIKHTSDEIYHPVGTCKMGPDPKHGAVVNSRFKVYGVNGLRVCDASVIPFSMVGHTSAPSTMIGERCADFIKTQYIK